MGRRFGKRCRGVLFQRGAKALGLPVVEEGGRLWKGKRPAPGVKGREARGPGPAPG